MQTRCKCTKPNIGFVITWITTGVSECLSSFSMIAPSCLCREYQSGCLIFNSLINELRSQFSWEEKPWKGWTLKIAMCQNSSLRMIKCFAHRKPASSAYKLPQSWYCQPFDFWWPLILSTSGLPTGRQSWGRQFWVHQSSGLPTLIMKTYFDMFWTIHGKYNRLKCSSALGNTFPIIFGTSLTRP